MMAHITEISPRGDHNFGSTKMASGAMAWCNPEFHTKEANEINNLGTLWQSASKGCQMVPKGCQFTIL